MDALWITKRIDIGPAMFEYNCRSYQEEGEKEYNSLGIDPETLRPKSEVLPHERACKGSLNVVSVEWAKRTT